MAGEVMLDSQLTALEEDSTKCVLEIPQLNISSLDRYFGSKLNANHNRVQSKS